MGKSCKTCGRYWPGKEPIACCCGFGDFDKRDPRGWCEGWEPRKMSAGEVASRVSALEGEKEKLERKLAEADKRERYIAHLETHISALWRRIESEYPQGGFPDMGMFEDELRWLGVI